MNKSNDIIFDIALEVLKDEPVLQSWTFTDSELVKFAKMIARECAGTVASVSPCFGDYRDQIEVNMRDHCAKKIRERFGVE